MFVLSNNAYSLHLALPRSYSRVFVEVFPFSRALLARVVVSFFYKQ